MPEVIDCQVYEVSLKHCKYFRCDFLVITFDYRIDGIEYHGILRNRYQQILYHIALKLALPTQTKSIR